MTKNIKYPNLTQAQQITLIALHRAGSHGIPFDQVSRPMKALLTHGFISTENGRANITKTGEDYFIRPRLTK